MDVQMEQNTAETCALCTKTGRNSGIVTVYAQRCLILPIRRNDTFFAETVNNICFIPLFEYFLIFFNVFYLTLTDIRVIM